MFNFSKTSPNISTEDPRHPPTTGPASSLAPNSQSSAGTMVKVEYSFIDLEHRLGLAQASLHRHICTYIYILYIIATHLHMPILMIFSRSTDDRSIVISSY